MGIALAITVAGSIPACSGKSKGNEDVPPQLTFDRVQYRVYRGALLAAEGEAARATFRRDTGDLGAEWIAVRIPPEGERQAARIQAVRGNGNLREKRFFISGGVRAEQGGEVATTAEAHYDAADGFVRGDQPVVVRSGRLTVRGPRFRLDPRDQRLQIEGGAIAEAGAP